jgi:V8-like Glu-specific endopeptidase
VLEVHLPIHAQIVRVECEHHGRTSYGTGIVIDSKRCLTAIHCIHNFTMKVKYKGKDHVADVGKPQWLNDWVILNFREPVDAVSLQVRQTPLAEGEEVDCYGYGPPDGKLSWYRSRVFGELLKGTQPVSGDSGGPVLDSKGRLVTLICDKFEDRSQTWDGYAVKTTEFAEFVK